MAILTAIEKTNLQNIGGLDRKGYSTGPDYVSGNNNDLYNAACWSWALTGEYMSVTDHDSAAYIYENLFKWENGMGEPPTSLNNDEHSLARQLAVDHPTTIPLLVALVNNLLSAVAGDVPSQNVIRIALLKITAIANGFTPGNNSVANLVTNGKDVSDPALGDYALHMRSTSWYGWDHWGISILLPNGTRSFVQKVNGSNPAIKGYQDGHVFRNCNIIWDEHMPLTSIAINELLQTQVAIIVAP